MRVAARWSAQPGADHADHDRRHREVLGTAGMLAEHPLADEDEHEQAGRQRGLYDHQGRKQQCNYLQRPAEDRQPGAEHPAPVPDQAPDQGQTQVVLAGRLLGAHRLQGNP